MSPLFPANRHDAGHCKWIFSYLLCLGACLDSSGKNASILHYGHAGRPNDAKIGSSDMLLYDMVGLSGDLYLGNLIRAFHFIPCASNFARRVVVPVKNKMVLYFHRGCRIVPVAAHLPACDGLLVGEHLMRVCAASA